MITVPRSMPRSAWPFLLVSIFHLGCQLVGAEEAGRWSKVLLMPALALVLVAGGRPWPRLLGVALFFSWLGDLALLGDGDGWFLAGIAMFLLAQLAYARLFASLGDPARTSSRPWLALPYAGWWLGLVVFFTATAGPGPMLLAVAVYGLALASMAWLAHRVGPVTALGALTFLVSDSLIGIAGFADVELPAHGFWVMATYLVAQGLIVLGVLDAAQEREPVRSSA
jgi:uncharacterized membrane protein YhhN